MKKYIYPLLLLLTAGLWGFGFTAQAQASALSIFTVGTVRYFIGALFLVAAIPLLDLAQKNGRRLLSLKKPPDFTKSELIGGFLCGAVLTAASALQQTGLSMGASAGKAGFITALYVLIVPIIALLFKRISPVNVWVGVGIAVVGFWLLCITDDFTVACADAILLLCAVAYALHITVIDRFSPRCDGVRLSCIQFLTAGVLNLLLALTVDGGVDLAGALDAILPLLYLGIASTGIAYTLQVIGQGGMDPAVASIIMSLESVFSVLGGAVVLGEVLLPREYAGCAIVFAAVIIAQLDLGALRRKKKGAESTISKE